MAPPVLGSEDSKAVAAAVARVESRTGARVAVAMIRKADSYAELPWKAFALGASIAALATVLADVWSPQWMTADSALTHAVLILGAGAACALAAVFVPRFARLFLRETHGHVEVTQHAKALFLERELFRTEHRNAVLILVSEFERRVEILPDVGLRDRITDVEWQRVVDAMTSHLRNARRTHALQDGLDAVERLLVSKGFRGLDA